MSDVIRTRELLDSEDPRAAEELLPLVYEELRRLAAVKMAGEKPPQTLQATALVHEVWLRLAGDQGRRWRNRGQFLVAAAEAMRRILIDRARKRGAKRRGGEWERVDLEHASVGLEDPDEMVLAVSEAVEKLEAEDPTKAQIVKLRYFVGLTPPEIAQTLGMPESTLRRHWAFARSWLYAEIKNASG